MYDGSFVGLDYSQLKWKLEKEIKANLPALKQSLTEESKKHDSIDDKIASTIAKSLEEVLPHIISAAIQLSNEQATKTLARAFGGR